MKAFAWMYCYLWLCSLHCRLFRKIYTFVIARFCRPSQQIDVQFTCASPNPDAHHCYLTLVYHSGTVMYAQYSRQQHSAVIECTQGRMHGCRGALRYVLSFLPPCFAVLVFFFSWLLSSSHYNPIMGIGPGLWKDRFFKCDICSQHFLPLATHA